MSLDPLRATEHVVQKYLSYLETTFGFSDKDLNNQFIRELRLPDKFAKGPILEATPPFETSCSIEDLIREGVLSEEFLKLKAPELPVDRPLYLHQEQAVRKVVSGRNIIVATGTGSGKTETFLIPILNYLFRQKEQGRLGSGVRALLLYPMNALANDQLKRLRKLLRNYPEITFGSYTGETKHGKNKALEHFHQMYPGETKLSNELLSREEMKESPPHILLTNYAMLEYLLLRPADNVFFDGKFAGEWRFIVLDEAHTYSGAKGIEMAMLLRRLKDRVVASRPGALQCIATSATLGGDAGDYRQVTNFGVGLFSENFERVADDESRQDVIIGRRKELIVAEASWGIPPGELYLSWAKIMQEASAKLSDLYAEGKKYGVPDAVLQEAKGLGDCKKFLYTVLAGDARLIRLQKMLEASPCSLEQAASNLFPAEDQGREMLVALVDLANRARLQEESQPLLPARYHLFIRAIEGGFVALLPEKRFFLERREWIEAGGVQYPVFEAATCNRCNALYFAGETSKENKVFRQPGKRFSDDRNSLEYYLLMEGGEPVPDNEDELFLGAEAGTDEEYILCGKCGAIGHTDNVDLPCNCGRENYFRVIKVSVKEGNIHKCPACGSRTSVGSVVRRFILGAEAVTSVLGTALYQQIPEEELEVSIADMDDEWASPASSVQKTGSRKMLIFSDSRQDAAFFATYLQNSYEQILQRRLLTMTLEQHKKDVIANRWQVSDLAKKAKETLLDLGIYTGKSRQELEETAWKWVLHEFMSTERIGLEGLGLMGFVPPIQRKWSPPLPFRNGRPWNFTDDEATALIMTLLDSVRKRGAVLFPDSVKPTDDFFAPRNREYFFNMRASVRGRIFSWLPSAEGGNNSRLDYITRLAQSLGSESPREHAAVLLEGIWEKLLTGDGSLRYLFSMINDGRNGPVFRLKPELWELQPAVIDSTVRWYRCDRCRRLTLHNVCGVCPTYRCTGTLQECNPAEELAENHYRRLYLEIFPLPMRTFEHTAQLVSERAAEVQKDFYEGKINILSCSTTFELGVDVGDLETVFMRNVPPSAANYIQRAGRAGRRTSSTAFVLTFAQRRSHDFSHFADPLRVIKGEIRPPYFEISNDKIVRRHMYAVAIAQFWRRNPDYFGSVEKFFTNEEKGSAVPELSAFLRSRPADLELALSRIVPGAMHEKVGLTDWNWVDGLLNAQDGVLARAEKELLQDLAELAQAEVEYSKSRNHFAAGQVKRVITTIKSRDILGFLSQNNVIPKYGFPVDVVKLQIHHHGDAARGLELDRDLKIALSEYAPDSQVIAGGKLWTSRYVKKLPDREPVKYRYAICRNCGLYRSQIAEMQGDLSTCLCGHKVGPDQGIFITPEFGFIAGKPGVPGMNRPQKTYATRKYFAQAGNVLSESELELYGTVVKVQTGTDGRLAVINNAGRRGFRICEKCGYAEIFKGKSPGRHNNSLDKECRGRFSRFSLGYEFKTDILQLWFPDYFNAEEGFWWSLLYGILEGACNALDIERQDVDGTLYYYSGNRHSPALVLFDDVPGGAGHVRNIAEEANLLAALERTLEIVSRCDCGGERADTSCYGCLRNYSNQYCHDVLKRGYVIEFLANLLQ